jgi:DNA polymerase III subunit delta
MASLSFDDLFRALRRGEVPGALYLHGAEDVLKDEVVATLLDRVVDPALRDFNVDVRSATSLDPEQAETLCHTLPMMADRRVVVIRDVEAWNRRARAKGAVLRYLERPAPETVLILVQGASDADPDAELAARTTTMAADPLPPNRAERWVEREAGRLGVTLEPEAVSHLVRATGASLQDIRTELAKLAGLADGTALGLTRVAELLGVRHGETQYDWRDAVLAGDTATALRILPHVLAQSGVSGVGLVMLLGTSLIGVGLARSLYDRGERGRLAGAVKGALFKIRPPRVSYDEAAREWSRHAPDWPRRRLEAALDAALRADQRLKSTTLAGEQAVLAELVLELEHGCPRAAA